MTFYFFCAAPVHGCVKAFNHDCSYIYAETQVARN